MVCLMKKLPALKKPEVIATTVIEVKKFTNNPRVMSKEAKEGLAVSMDTFLDSSGIVVSKRTGELIGGNHRFENLEKKHGKKNLSYQFVMEEAKFGTLYMIMAKGSFTGFLLREVDWTEEEEKLANISMNNPNIQGQYTDGLQGMLDNIKNSLNIGLAEKLKVDYLSFSWKVPSLNLGNKYSAETVEKHIKKDDTFDDYDVETDVVIPEDVAPDQLREVSEERNAMLDDAKTQESGPVSIVVGNFKVVADGDILDMVKKEVAEFIKKRPYADRVNIL